jgi:hypothetical protein
MKMSQQIAKTILDQIKAIDFWALGAYGAHEYVALSEDEKTSRLGGVMFKCSGTKLLRGGRAIIELKANDTYTIRVGRMVKGGFVKLTEHSDAHAEDLVNVLEEAIG